MQAAFFGSTKGLKANGAVAKGSVRRFIAVYMQLHVHWLAQPVTTVRSESQSGGRPP
jgi:hypothetical protein